MYTLRAAGYSTRIRDGGVSRRIVAIGEYTWGRVVGRGSARSGGAATRAARVVGGEGRGVGRSGTL